MCFVSVTGNKVLPWSALRLFESTHRCFTCPKTRNIDHQLESFADLHHLTEEYNFYMIGMHMKFDKYLYSEQSPKFPLQVDFKLDNIGKSSKCVSHRLYHNNFMYIECLATDVLVSQATNKSAPYPSWWVKKFAPLCKNERLPQLVLPVERLENPCHTRTDVGLSETDVYKHTNAASYIKYCYESIFRNVSKRCYKNFKSNHLDSGVKCVAATYTGQSRLLDVLDIVTWEDSANDNTVYCKIFKHTGEECCDMKMEFYNDNISG